MGTPQQHHYQLTETETDASSVTMELKLVVKMNDHASLSGIPPEERTSVCSQRQNASGLVQRPLSRLSEDKDSGILNDPNGWFKDPRDLVTAIERIVYVSVESTRIIEGLPSHD